MPHPAEQPFLIRVVSIANSSRRPAFTERATTSLQWAFHDASTSNTTGLEYDEKRAILNCSRPLLRGELGCFSSHHALWRLCVDTDRPIVVVEDDVEVDWQFLEKLAETYEDYGKYEYVRFATTFKADRIAAGQMVDRVVDELLGNPRGTQGYLMRPSHAKRLLQRIRRIERPIDDEIDRCWKYGAPNLVVRPPVVTDRDEPSEIIAEKDVRKIQKQSIAFIASKILEKIKRDTYITSRVIINKMQGNSLVGRA